MPAYNGEKTLGDSIDSILNQDYESIQLIVIDDASKDKTFDVANARKPQGNITSYEVLKHETNLGLSATLNQGVRACKGDYVVVLHQDCVLADRSWITNALEYFANSRVAVVTGYYGIPPNRLCFTAKAFGVFRRQYHAQNFKRVEEETAFSEGKCDVYRKDILDKIGGFPERFRIAGEDLYVSYEIRRSGYMILKSYKLPVVQKFGSSADTLSKNLRKEFIFGKAMGGVFPILKTFLFNRINMSQYSKTRSLQRATQPLFVVFFLLSLLLAAIFQSTLLLFLGLAVLAARYSFYVGMIWNELLRMSNVFHKQAGFSFLEALVIAALGIISDFVYTFGFGYGLALYFVGARL